MATQEKDQSGFSVFEGILNKTIWVAGTACVAFVGLIVSANLYQQQNNIEERAKMSPLVAEFNGHSYMVTGRDSISEVFVGANEKFESAVLYDFARGVAVYGKNSPAPSAVLGFNQLPDEIIRQVKQTVCQTTKKAIDDGVEVSQDSRQFVANYCLP